MRVLYFAWVREKIGIGQETVSPPETVTTVQSLLDWLCERGGGYHDALSDSKQVKVAVNQDYVHLSHPVEAGDEVAIFPPVTGG